MGQARNRAHEYTTRLSWSSNAAGTTSSYRAYSRNHTVEVPGKVALELSSDAAFRGDANRLNPEELLLASLSSCHLLWYLHLCADAGILVLSYEDRATGVMEESDGSGRFREACLNPRVVIADREDAERAASLHRAANRRCFIANSLNFEVRHRPAILVNGSDELVEDQAEP